MVEVGIEISTELYRLSQDQNYLWDAFSFAEAIKSRLLIEEILESRTITLEGLPDSLQLQLDGLKADIDYYQNHLSNTKPTSAKDSLKVSKWIKLLVELEFRQNKLIEEVVKQYPTYRKQKLNDTRVDAQFIEDRLPDQSLLIEYFWGENVAYRFQMDQEEISVESIPLTEEILRALDQTAAQTRKPDMSKEGLLGFCKNASELFKAIKLPTPDSNRYDSWYIVPDGPLAFIPFEVLLSTYPEEAIKAQVPSQAYRKLPYLLKSQHIQYLYAASLIEKKVDQGGTILQNLAAFAPNYDGLLQLKHNKASAQEIGKLLGGKTYLDQDASENTFKSEVHNFKAVHLAVHGNANVEDPIRAYLDFGKGQEDDDGKLYVHELYSLSLDSRIVSLIACEAGYGKLQKGEGVMSLARAFRMAGARSIMTSLWKADGRAAAPISESFYKFLKKGQKPSRALKTAKLDFLASASPDMTHPYFWATYVLTGQDISVWNPFFRSYGIWLLLLVGGLLIFWLRSVRNKKIKLS
ncbi:MAG: CHAT domain-containing protein [Bacteroidota bacterium]